MSGRKPAIVPNELLHLSLPPDLLGRLKLFLWSDLECRVPRGAYQQFFSERLREYFDTHKSIDVSSFLGQPAGTHIILGTTATLAAMLHHLKEIELCKSSPLALSLTSPNQSKPGEGQSDIPTTQASG